MSWLKNYSADRVLHPLKARHKNQQLNLPKVKKTKLIIKKKKAAQPKLKKLMKLSQRKTVHVIVGVERAHYSIHREKNADGAMMKKQRSLGGNHSSHNLPSNRAKKQTFKLSQATSSQSTQQTQKENTQEDQEKDDDDNDEKVSFYLRVGKYKKFKYM